MSEMPGQYFWGRYKLLKRLIMCTGITTLAKIGVRKELKFIDLTYEEIRRLYEQRAKRNYDNVSAFKKEGGLLNAKNDMYKMPGRI